MKESNRRPADYETSLRSEIIEEPVYLEHSPLLFGGIAADVEQVLEQVLRIRQLRAYDRPQERGFVGRQMAAPGFDSETDVGASKDKGQPICWPHPVPPLAPASTATPPLRGSASVVLDCAPQ